MASLEKTGTRTGQAIKVLAARRHQWGAAAVEFALVLPLLMMLVLGTIDWGFYFWQTQVCTNAAREGAREGSLYRSDDDATRTQAENTVEAYLVSALLDPSNLDPNPANVLVAADDVTVTVVYRVSSLTGFTGYVFPDTIRAVAVMRR